MAPEYSDADGATPRARSGTGDSEQPVRSGGRATRSAHHPAVNGSVNPRKRKHIDTYNDIDEMSDEEDAGGASGDDWDSDKNDGEDDNMPDADDDDDQMSEADDESEEEDVEPQSLIVKLKISPKGFGEVGRAPNGSSTLRTADGPTQASAPRCETYQQPVATGVKLEAAQQHPGSSPSGPSSYPTPTSSSYLQPERKSATAQVPALLQPSLIAPSNYHGHPHLANTYTSPKTEQLNGAPHGQPSLLDSR